MQLCIIRFQTPRLAWPVCFRVFSRSHARVEWFSRTRALCLVSREVSVGSSS